MEASQLILFGVADAWLHAALAGGRGRGGRRRAGAAGDRPRCSGCSPPKVAAIAWTTAKEAMSQPCFTCCWRSAFSA